MIPPAEDAIAAEADSATAASDDATEAIEAASEAAEAEAAVMLAPIASVKEAIAPEAEAWSEEASAVAELSALGSVFVTRVTQQEAHLSWLKAEAEVEGTTVLTPVVAVVADSEEQTAPAIFLAASRSSPYRQPFPRTNQPTSQAVGRHPSKFQIAC